MTQKSVKNYKDEIYSNPPKKNNPTNKKVLVGNLVEQSLSKTKMLRQ